MAGFFEPAPGELRRTIVKFRAILDRLVTSRGGEEL
jgi:hypothetical protein